jgi:hypothetical protein
VSAGCSCRSRGQDRFPRHAEGGRPLGQRQGAREDVGHHIVVLHAVWTHPRRRTARVRAHDADTGRGRDLGQHRIPAAPGVVEQIGPGRGHGRAHLMTPRVDADDQIGMGGANCGHELDRPVELLGHVDLVAGRGLDPADVDDLGAVGHHRLDPVQRLLEREGGPTVVERIGGAVDDRHHGKLTRPEFAAPQPQHDAAGGRSRTGTGRSRQPPSI